MRLDAYKGDRGNVWHAEWCRRLERVVWVDDAIPAWGESAGRVVNGEIEIIEHRARKIIIRPGPLNLVIINPVDDADNAPAQAEQYHTAQPGRLMSDAASDEALRVLKALPPLIGATA